MRGVSVARLMTAMAAHVRGLTDFGRSSYRPAADEQEWVDGVEGGFAVVTGGNGLGYVEGEVPGVEQQGHDGQVHSRHDQGCCSYGYSES